MRCSHGWPPAGPDRLRERPQRHRENGTATAELAACLPVLVLVIAVAISTVGLASARVRAQDAAREAARAAARKDAAAAGTLAGTAAPGGAVRLARSGDLVSAHVRLVVHPLAAWLPAFTVTGDATAMAEP